MTSPNRSDRPESWLDRWRAHLQPIAATDPSAAAMLEERLHEQRAALHAAGLDEDEALLIAVRRIGEREPRTQQFARRQIEREIWKPLTRGVSGVRETLVAFGLALLAAAAIKLPELWGRRLDDDAGFYARNLALFVLPMIAGYFVWKRGSDGATRLALIGVFAAAALAANLPAFARDDPLEALLALHLPIALWLAVGIAHAGGRWHATDARMDFVRFSGELVVYYVLMALGGAVLMGFTFALFESLGLDAEPFFERWLLPCGALGAAVIAAWLVETRHGVVESLAPLLTRLFTPLFAILLLAFLATMTWTGRGPLFHRDLLIAFDLLLAVVVGLLLYAIAGRDPYRPAGVFDLLQIVLVLAALLVDGAALWVMAGRIAELGPTPNRIAALGENLILLLNLAGSAVLYLRFVRGRIGIAGLVRWQTRFLPVYAAWAAIVVLLFPWLFAQPG